MKKTVTMLLAGLILAMAPLASAGNKGGTFSVSPMVGGITFEDNQHLETAPLFGARAGYNFTSRIGVEALFDYARTQSTVSKKDMDFYRYGGELLYHLWPDNKFVPYLAVGYAGMNLKGDNLYPAKTKGVFDYGLGFKYFVTEDVAWRVDVRGLMYSFSQKERNAIEYTTGVYIPFGGSQEVSKLADPPPPPPVVKAPPAAPLATLTASPASINKDQSSTLSWTSQNATECEISPAIGPVKTQGSTSVTPDDKTTYTLNCKGEGGSAVSTATVVVTIPAPPPPPPPAKVAPPVVEAAQPKASAAAARFCNKPAILRINFDVDKYNIKPQYHAELKTVGDFLKEFPTSQGEIAGHTDSTNTKAYNQKLSERRANSVKQYIISNFNIAPERLTSKGYGLEKPIATNKTKEGKAKNRRIEANFVCE